MGKREKRLRVISMSILLLAFPWLIGGCAILGFNSPSTKKVYEKPYSEVFNACVDSLHEIGVGRYKRIRKSEGVIHYTLPYDEGETSINVKELAQNKTEVKINSRFKGRVRKKPNLAHMNTFFETMEKRMSRAPEKMLASAKALPAQESHLDPSQAQSSAPASNSSSQDPSQWWNPLSWGKDWEALEKPQGASAPGEGKKEVASPTTALAQKGSQQPTDPNSWWNPFSWGGESQQTPKPAVSSQPPPVPAPQETPPPGLVLPPSAAPEVEAHKKALIQELSLLMNLKEGEDAFLYKLEPSELEVMLAGIKEQEKEKKSAEQVNKEAEQTHIALAKTLHDQGQYEECVQELKRAIEINPYNPLSHTNLGEAYKHLSLYQEAVKELEKALEIDPTFVNAHVNLGIIYDDFLDDPQKAVWHYTRYVELGGPEPQVADWLEALKKELELKKKSEEAKGG